MKKRRKHRNSSHIEAAITGGDIAIATFSAIIYYTRAYIEGNLYTISFPAAIIWCNIFRLLNELTAKATDMTKAITDITMITFLINPVTSLLPSLKYAY